MPRVTLITGGNLGDVRGTLAAAERLVAERAGTVVARSTVRKSTAWGDFCDGEAGGLFLNQALIIETPLSPMKLLDALQKIEKELGREEGQKAANSKATRAYTSRPIDIDILFYDDLIMHTDRLTIPHPLIAEREFVLLPLVELIPDYPNPATGKTPREMLDTRACFQVSAG
ncbi:MAG: 2-amino-4-hydroxy-6-hydroxymethyldihydropteridine diphosphokinase [Rikenellaceae bacterium]|nr:2-amino-4-hydroxy-6-hydroxymethyldihydropteridine diphosphokinase [Rikenellaceae bacterium]MCL2693442.1 2-amino-4-hydroxy-6-hydroxymethyldihydropteridine diphosphokinase [Rikenellaceae bacterium]